MIIHPWSPYFAVKKKAGTSRKRERLAIMRPFLDSSFKHSTRGIYLDIRSHTLNIATRTREYLENHQSWEFTPRSYFIIKFGQVCILRWKKSQKGNWNCSWSMDIARNIGYSHLLDAGQQGNWRRRRRRRREKNCFQVLFKWIMLCHGWALTMSPTGVYQCLHIRTQEKSTVSAHIWETGQVHNLYFGGIVLCYSTVPGVCHRLQRARVP